MPKCKECGCDINPCGSSIDKEGNYICFDCDEEITKILKEIQ